MASAKTKSKLGKKTRTAIAVQDLKAAALIGTPTQKEILGAAHEAVAAMFNVADDCAYFDLKDILWQAMEVLDVHVGDQ